MIQFFRAFGLLSACVLALALPSQAQARWLKAETSHFVIYSESGERLLREYAEILEDFDEVLRLYHGISGQEDFARKLHIYLLTTQPDIYRVQPGISPYIAGYYSADETDIYALAIRDHSREKANDDTIFHEYVHHFMLQHRPYGYPSWLIEGWAEYFMTTDIKPDRIDVGLFSEMRASSLGDHWLPYQDVLRKTKAARERSNMFYAQSWLLTHYFLASTERRPKLTEYIRLVGSGVDSADAMEQALGMNMKALEEQLHAYTRKGLPYTSHPRRMRIAREVTVTALPKSADDLLLESLRLIEAASDEEDRPKVLKVIRGKADHHAGDRFADLTLARAETLYGDRPAGEAILNRYIAADPADAEALRLLAESKIATGEKDEANRAALYVEARALLARSLKAEPDHYQSLYAIARTRRVEPGYPTAGALEVLLLAHTLAPQVDEISVQAAQGLVARGRDDEARPLLAVLANDPLGGDVAEAA
jgi:tetratricopeptide (TPR) repeat protein